MSKISVRVKMGGLRWENLKRSVWARDRARARVRVRVRIRVRVRVKTLRDRYALLVECVPPHKQGLS